MADTLNECVNEYISCTEDYKEFKKRPDVKEVMDENKQFKASVKALKDQIISIMKETGVDSVNVGKNVFELKHKNSVKHDNDILKENLGDKFDEYLSLVSTETHNVVCKKRKINE